MSKRSKIVDQDTSMKTSNPFPASPVARLALGSDILTIETDAVRLARANVDNYLNRVDSAAPTASEHEGAVIAIVGEYGTGKTHIALDILQRIAAEGDAKVHIFYLDAPSDTFLALYRDRFIPKLLRNEVIARVEECYADILAEDLASSELTRPLATSLKRREIAPSDVGQTLGLMESEFIRRLGERLRSITEKDDFGIAMLLLRRPEFQDAVWEWLSGNEPDPTLKERGVVRRIDTDAAALEAMGVMSFLFGSLGHRFVLVIDEMEKVLSHGASHAPDAAALLALKKLMEVISKTRALLIMCGLPDFVEVLPEDARQRISSIIHPSLMTTSEAIRYIGESQRSTDGNEKLDPFSPETVDYVVTICGGNARKVIRLCYHSFQAAQAANTSVSPAMVREVARAQFEISSVEDVSAELVRVVAQRGWLFEQNKTLSAKKISVVIDVWLPLEGDNGSGIAIVVARSIIQEPDAAALQASAKNIDKILDKPSRHYSMLVVNGYLAENLKAQLESSFTRILVYRSRSFAEDADAALRGLRLRLEAEQREDVLQTIKGRVEQVSRQSDVIGSQLDDLRVEFPTQRDVEAAVGVGLKNFFGRLTSAPEPATSLPAKVERYFKAAELALQPLTQVISDAIDLSMGNGEFSSDGRHPLSRSAASHSLETLEPEPVGSFFLIQESLRKFRLKVSEVLTRRARRSMMAPEEQLGQACSTFDRTVERAERALYYFVRTSRTVDEAREELRLRSDRALAGRIDRSLSWSEEEVDRSAKILKDLGRDVFRASMLVMDSRLER